MALDATILAHQGGWDEILFVLTPLVVFAALLAVARRRVDRMEAADASHEAPVEHGSEPGPDS